MRFVPALAIAVTALALYVSSGVLDQIVTPDGPVRVALLPPVQALLGFVVVGLLGLLWLERRTVPRGTATAVRPQLAPLVLPALGLALLLVPYLPVVPDFVPAVQVLAGPASYVVWLAVTAQFAWTLWQGRFIRADWLQRLSLRHITVIVALITVCVSGLAASRLAATVLYPGGDEPHYLVIAQSLWRDGDLRIENNHTRGDYFEYFKQDLAPHYLTRGADGEIYSIHPVGMPVLIAPIFAAGGYPTTVFAFVLMAAFATALMWRTTVRITNAVGAATFGWVSVIATAPFLFNSFAIYPEIPAAVAVAVAFTLIAAPVRETLRVPAFAGAKAWRWLVIGAAAALLPWFSTKYAPMSAALVTVALGRVFYRPGTADASDSSAEVGTLRAALAVLAPYALSLLAWFYFFYAIWGVPLPQAPYGALVQTSPLYLLFGGPGLLFDQEYGLLPYAPVYVLAATGLVVMFRTDAENRRRAIEIILVFGALLGTVGAFRIWWGGSAPPGRPLTSGLPLLIVPMAFAFRAAPVASVQRAAQHLLLWISVGVAGILLFAQQGLLTANGRDGTSSLLEYLSPGWPAWTIAPSFVYHETAMALAHSAAWLLLAAGTAFAIGRMRDLRPGAASLAAMLSAATALLIAAVVMPALPLSPPWPSLDLRARARLAILDRFDLVARPVAIAYSPLRLTSPEEIVTHAAVVVEPALRTQPQPIRVLHNGRFSLPAGTYRVEIEWAEARVGQTIGLQIGRTGDPVEYWRVDARPGERWAQEFSVPVDAPFVGLRGSAELEKAIDRIRIVPVSIVNAGDRLRGPAVLAASQSGPAALYYYDTFAAPERRGFWVGGAQRTRVTVSRPSADGPLVLRVHSGPVPNRFHISKFGWQHHVDLQPETPALIEVPMEDAPEENTKDDVVTLEFAADASFVPRDLDPSATDTRALGVWVEVVK